MKKFTLTLLIAAIVVIMAISASAEVVASGECGADGDNITWTLDSDGLLTISGSGEMGEIDSVYGAPWRKQTITSVVIEEGVTVLASNSFIKEFQSGDILTIKIPSTITRTKNNNNYSALVGYENVTLIVDGNCTGNLSGLGKAKNVVLTENVTEIADNAFSSFFGKGRLTVGENVKTIGDQAFYSSDFSEIILGSNVKSIGSKAFYSSGVKEIIIPESVTEIDTDSLFSSCSELESITINTPITTLGASMFSHCKKLEHVTLPNTLNTIEKAAFGNCVSLATITLPASLSSIAEDAFSGCTSLTSITIPSGVKTVGDEAFPSSITEISYSGTATEYMGISFGSLAPHATARYSLYIDGDLVENFAVPSGTETINRHAFYGCSSLKSVNIPSSVKTIDSSAFEGSALESVTIAEGVETIGFRAFADCESLKEVTIPESVKTIVYYAFLSENFEKLTVLSKDVEIYSEAVADNVTIVCYKDSTAYDYAIEYGLNYEIINEDGTTTVPTKLATPQNLSFTDQNGYFTGICYFDAVENANKYQFKLYRGNFVILELTTNGRYFGSTIQPLNSTKRGFDFSRIIYEIEFETGEYYFTVQASSTDVSYSSSDVAISDTFYYVRPEEKLSAPKNLAITQDLEATFSEVENAAEYYVTFYVVENGEYEELYSTWGNFSRNGSIIVVKTHGEIENYMLNNELDSVDIAFSASAMSCNLCEVLSSDIVYSDTFTYKKTTVPGDIDGDGVITVADTLTSLKAMLNGEDADNADMNGDGIINLLDVLRILKAAVQ